MGAITEQVREIDPQRLGISPRRAFAADPREWFGDEEIAKSKRYVTPKRRVNAVRITLVTLVDLAIIRTHAMPNMLRHLGWNNWFLEVMAVMAVTTAIDTLVAVPFGYWVEMVYDKKWEFSTTTRATFLSDLAKGLTIGLVLNAIIVGLLWWGIRSTEYWWLVGWVMASLFSIGFAVIYPRVIAPMFNKFQQLDDAELHARIIAVAHGVGADIEKVEIEDTSKRDKRKNAYVGGAGKTRRMVICDTMLEWPADEVTWVSAHEIGHWRRKHILKTMPWLTVLLLLNFVVLKVVVQSHWVLRFAGVQSLREPGAVPLFFFLFALPTLITGPIGQYFSRVNEREADLFGLEAVPDVNSAMTAMRKLHIESLSDLTPSLWNRLNRSHPPVAERLAMMQEWGRRNAS